MPVDQNTDIRRHARDAAARAEVVMQRATMIKTALNARKGEIIPGDEVPDLVAHLDVIYANAAQICNRTVDILAADARNQTGKASAGAEILPLPVKPKE